MKYSKKIKVYSVSDKKGKAMTLPKVIADSLDIETGDILNFELKKDHFTVTPIRHD